MIVKIAIQQIYSSFFGPWIKSYFFKALRVRYLGFSSTVQLHRIWNQIWNQYKQKHQALFLIHFSMRDKIFSISKSRNRSILFFTCFVFCGPWIKGLSRECFWFISASAIKMLQNRKKIIFWWQQEIKYCFALEVLIFGFLFIF